MTSLGAAVTALRVPDAKGGNLVDVVLGFDTAEDYLSAKNPYFGATVGRVANRDESTSVTGYFRRMTLRKFQIQTTSRHLSTYRVT